ncbi:MAG: family 43 glycosylhydrolase [Oscillospiraceae bacterium]|nr:family 43 glycosylhydrolase [Oscillospiraceae bacterium]
MKSVKLLSGITALILAAGCLTGSALAAYEGLTPLTDTGAAETTGGITISSDQISTEQNKDTRYNNPISPYFFCADPTAVEYNGRLYLYGTNDHEQFLAAGPDQDNTYEKIKSMLVFSTDDMENWVYHGKINIGQIAPWITNSWAPSVVSRVESDGKTHFYMYFSNNGLGVGVITSTDPVTGWTDPLKKPLISTGTPGLKDCPNPFDPGAVIDENGVGWLAFGAGKASNGTDYMPGSARIVKLGDDMISFASDFAEIPAPYLFEASELNYINGTYVYTYCSDWSDHAKQWEYDCPAPGGCGMVYMTSKTPLDPASWKMGGEYFVNPGQAGFDYSNNHTHLHHFRDHWYIFYHTLALKHGMGISGSYRSMAVDEIEVDEASVTIQKIGGTHRGPKIIEAVNPFETNLAAELNGTAEVGYDLADQHIPAVKSGKAGAWISVRNSEFTQGESDDAGDSSEMVQTDLNTLVYHITVKSVAKPTTVTMYPSANDGTDCPGSVAVTGAGQYEISCDLNGAKGLMNMGYFRAADDTEITFEIDSITVNGTFSVDISAELTNTREWADGLRNIWNGFSDGDNVYQGDGTAFRYVKADDAIEFFASKAAAAAANAPLLGEKIRFLAQVSGSGTVEVRLDSPDGALLTSVSFKSQTNGTVYSDEIAAIGGTHDLYFVFSDSGVTLRAWRFLKTGEASFLRGDVNADGTVNGADAVMLQKWLLTEGELTDPQAAELTGDGRLNASDLTELKRLIS